eukprot:1109376-Prymnesium_polylepis.1
MASYAGSLSQTVWGVPPSSGVAEAHLDGAAPRPVERAEECRACCVAPVHDQLVGVRPEEC